MIADEWTRIQNKYKIGNGKTVTITTDNAESNKKAAKLNKMSRIPCSPHKYNRIVRPAIEKFPPITNLSVKVKDVVSHVHRSTKAKRKFNKCQKTFNDKGNYF